MAKAQFEKARNFMLSGVSLQYTKVSKPTTYQGKQQWETSIITDDPKVAEMWDDNHLGVRGTPKMNPNSWTVSLNRKQFTKDGTEQEPVRVVGADKKAFTDEERRKIGNGSTGNLILWQGHYDNEYGTGVTTSLTAIQVTDLLKYEGGMDEMDFDSFGADGNKEMAETPEGTKADLF